MAHECPDCGQTCHCNGDIDDCCFSLEEDVNRCVHYLKPDCDGYESEDENEKSDAHIPKGYHIYETLDGIELRKNERSKGCR